MENKQTPPKSRQEHPSTYFVQDRSNMDEMARLQVQDRLMTSSMGGVLAEQDDTARFQQILDVGCGTGGWLIESAQALPGATHLVGVDVSNKMLDYARSQAADAGVSERVEFHMMDALRMLEFPDRSFDLVNQRMGMSYLRTWDWPKLLQEYQRVLKKGGLVRVTEGATCYESSSPAYLKVNEFCYRAFHQAGHLFVNAPDGVTSNLARLLTQYGYKGVQTKTHAMQMHNSAEAYEDTERFFRVIKPFLHKWGQLPDNYDEIYQQMLQEVQQPDFYAIVELRSAWGSVPQ